MSFSPRRIEDALVNERHEPQPTRTKFVVIGPDPIDAVPEPDRADVRLRAGTLGFREVGLVARRLAAMQAEAVADDSVAVHGRPDALLRLVRDPCGWTGGDPLVPEQAMEIERQLAGFIEANAGWFEARVRRGRVVRGHGDLRLSRVGLDVRGTVRMVGAHGVPEGLRCGDAIVDVVTLATDLEHRGRPDLAEHFVASWAEASGDYDAYRGLAFYGRLRAYVRAKLEAAIAADASVDVQRRDVAGGIARRCFVHAVPAIRQPRFPSRVIAVGGIMASGKSTLACALAERLGAARVSTDRTRKQMLGVEPSALRVDPNAWRRALAEDLTEAVYDQMLRRAEVVLRSGRPVVLDATFRSSAFRAGARALATRNRVPFVYIECVAPPHVGRERLRERPSASDGRLEIFDAFVAGYEPPDELAREERIRVDTTRPFDQSLADVLATVPTWP